ncbi:MAG: ABC transporter ATP-binding protein/permease [Bacilli bacterium]|nr:ABC transporter ATP-binding protein/permease [Bacilli bacterium]
MPRGSGFQEEALPEKLNFIIWVKVFLMVKKAWKYLWISLLTGLVISFVDATMLPLFFAGAIDAASTIFGAGYSSFMEVKLHIGFLFGSSFELNILAYIFIMVGLIIARSVLIFFNFYNTNLFSMKIVSELRREGFRKVQTLSFSYFDKNASGWIIARLQGDTSTIGDTLSHCLNNIIWSSGSIIFSIITMLSVNYVYALIIIASFPVVIFITPLFERVILVRHRANRNARSKYVGYVAETIEGAKTIKSLSLENYSRGEEEKISEENRYKLMRAFKVNAFFNPTISFLSTALVALIVFLSLQQDLPEAFYITPAVTILFITYVSSIYQPIQGLAEDFTEIMSAQASAEKLDQLLEAKPDIEDRPDIKKKYGDILNPKKEAYKPFEGKVDFEDVRFDYGNGIEVIHPLTLRIPKGQSLAIVGETGSGKTTIANLLCRFYEPTGGLIKIDDIDYREYGMPYLHSQIGYVQQTPYLFPGTIADNLRYGKEDATLEEMKEACEKVGIDEYIESLPDKYDSKVAAGGGSMSQGQKQLVSFARALLKNPAILILDEATSSVDTATEAALQKGVELLMRNRTSIAIAHRLSTIIHSDRILYLEKGYVVEEGTHEELLAKKGKYCALFESQFEQLTSDEQLLLSKKKAN